MYQSDTYEADLRDAGRGHLIDGAWWDRSLSLAEPSEVERVTEDDLWRERAEEYRHDEDHDPAGELSD